MGPKVAAISEFCKATGNRGIICHLKDIERAVAGDAGTEIIPTGGKKIKGKA
jgi:carbamate kinase